MSKRLNQDAIRDELLRIQKGVTTPTSPIVLDEKKEGIDDNAFTDFMGNVAWGFGETFLVPTLMDVVSETREDGLFGSKDLSAEFGSQDWSDDSWAGNAGYLVGTTLGVFTGFGAVGKLTGVLGRPLFKGAAHLLTKTGGSALKKQAAIEITEQLGKSKLKYIATKEVDDIVGFTHKAMGEATDEAIKKIKDAPLPGGVWGNIKTWYSKGGAIKVAATNPASQKIIRDRTIKAVTDKLVGITGKATLPKGVVDDVVKTMLKYGPKNIDKELALKYAHTSLGQAFKGETIGQYLVAAVHEGLTLGTFDVLTGEAADLYANANNLNDEVWERKTVGQRFLHGMGMGGLFAAVRGLPGGKDVAFGKSGMIADLKHIGTAMAVRFKNLDKMSWDKKYAAARTIYSALKGEAKNVFPNSGVTQTMLDSGKKSTQLIEGVENIVQTLKKDASGSFIWKMIKEIGKDGKDSFLRASLGSLVMNYGGYLDRIKEGEIGTEAYPWSKASLDHFIGMLYMKRRRVDFKTGAGEPMERRRINFFDDRGAIGAEPGETSKMLRSLKILNGSNEYLEALSLFNPSMEKEIRDKIIGQALSLDEGLVEINSTFDKNKVSIEKQAENIEGNILLRAEKEQLEGVEAGSYLKEEKENWASKVSRRVTELKAAGNHEAAATLDGQLLIAQEAEALLMPVIKGKGITLSLMTESQAIDFTIKLASTKVGGQSLTPTNAASVIKKSLRTGSVKVAEQLKEQHIVYIQESLKALGLDAQIGSDGRLLLPKNYQEAISNTLKIDEDSYLHTNVLNGAIDKGMKAGVVKVGKSMADYGGHDITSKHIEGFKKVYGTHTESMHEYALGSEGKGNSRWREESFGDVAPGEYLDSHILNSASIWNGIQTNFDHKRHQRAFELFAGEGTGVSDIKQKLRAFMEGAIEIEVDTEGKDISELSQEGATFAKAISDLVSGFNTFKTTNKKSVKLDVSKIENMREEFNREFGDLLENPDRVSELKNSMNAEFLDRLTSNSNLTVPIKKALSSVMRGTSILGTKMRDRIVLIRAEKLRELLSRDSNFSVEGSNAMLKAIDKYEELFEKPISRALGGGGRIEFADTNIAPNSDRFKLNEIRQEIIEITNMLDANVAENFNAVIGDISAATRGLENIRNNIDTYNKMTKGELKNSNMEFETAFNNLYEDYSDFVNRFIYFQETNDAAGLRIIADKQQRIAEIRNDIRMASLKSPKSVEAIREKIDNIMKEIKADYTKHKDVGSEAELNEYINDITNETAFAVDRTARPHANTVSISDTKYKSRWGLNDDFVNILKGESIALLDKATIPNAFRALNNEALGRLRGAIDGITTPELLSELLSAEGGAVEGFTLESYMNRIVAPIIEARRAIIEANPNTGSFDLFVRDTFALLSRGLNTKKIPTMEFRDGRFHIKESAISRWDKSVNTLVTDFSLESSPHAISLLSGSGVIEGKSKSFFNLEEINSIISKAGQGIELELTTSNMLTTKKEALMDKYKGLIPGDSTTKSVFAHVQLDEKTAVMIHSSAFNKIIGAWERSAIESGSLRGDLVAVLSESIIASSGQQARVITRAQATERVNEYIQNLAATHENSRVAHVQDLVLLTRMLRSGPHKIREIMMENGADIPASLKLLKYLKLDAPRTGMALSDRLFQFTEAFFNSQGGNMPEVSRQALDIALNHRRNNPNQRILDIYDESGNGETFFSSKNRAKALYREMLITERDGYSDVAEQDRAVELMAAKLSEMEASITNGPTFLSRDEMISTLVGQGASPDMFITNAEGQIIGFENAVKPIAFQSNINAKTGEITVYIAKTAYTYNPVFDRVMERLGIDAISFESSSKLNARKSGFGEAYERPSWDVPESMASTASTEVRESWDHQIVNHLTNSETDVSSIPIVHLDRNNIFIKSTASGHNATVTTGMYNWLSEGGVHSVSSQLGTQESVRTMNAHINNLKENPMYTIKLAEHLRGLGQQDGNSMTELIGVDWAVTSGGIPLFSNMLAQLDKIVVSEYLGNRNFTTAQTAYGRYPVMVPGSDLSIPQIEKASKLRFGGSGMNYHAGTQHVMDNLGSLDAGHHMIFRVGKKLAEKTGLKRGMELLVLTNGTIKGINDPRFYKDTGGGLSEKIATAKRIIGDDFRTIQRTLHSRGVETLNDAIIELAFGESIEAFNAPGQLRTIMNERLNGGFTSQGSNDILLTRRGSLEFLKDVNGQEFQRERDYDHTMLGENGDHYQGVYFAEVNVRTPMAGINDRVITKIEKIMGRTKGPVSEMNFMDVLEPQDADFDLDKSANFTNMSSRAMEDIYDLQGFESPASESFAEEFTRDFIFSSEGIKDYSLALAAIERKRAPLIRNMNSMSLMYQMMGKAQSNKYWAREARDMDPSIQMDKTRGGSGAKVGEGYIGTLLTTFKDKNDRYEIRLANGSDLVSTTQYMKRIIKATIDIYKKQQNLEGVDLESLVWFGSSDNNIKPIFQLTLKGEVVPWKAGGTAAMKAMDHLKWNIISPLNKLFNLANRTETLSDGTSLPMTRHDMVKAYNQIKYKIKMGGGFWDADAKKFKPNDYNILSENVLKFIGGGASYKGTEFGESSHPLIQGLKAMEASEKSLVSLESTPAVSGVLSYVYGEQMKSGDTHAYNAAISEIQRSQNLHMHVARIRYDLNKIKDRMIEFENFKKKGTQEFKALQGQHDRLNELYIEADGIFNRKMLVSEQRLNDSTIAKKNSFKPVYAYDGPVHIIKFDPYTKKPIKTIKIEQGKTYEYKAGDMIVKNPVQYEALESNEQKILRGQSRAFAGRLRGLSANDAKLVYGRYINYLEASKNIRANFNTSSEFTSKDSRSSMYEANTYEMLQEIVHLNENMGSKHALQFLRHMMAPNIKRNTWGVWSANNEQMVKSSVFSKNFNEISVINFLDKARRGEFSEISRDLATEWSTHILNESKKGWAIEFDPRVKKEFKAGNFVEFESFEEARSPILGKNKIAPGRNKPEFLTAEGINEHARDIMTGYLTGENILNPIEVYRLTTAMNNKPLAESRQAHAIHSALWRGVEKKSVGVNGLFESAGTTFTESSRLGVENLKESKTAAESIEKQLFDCR